MTPGQTEAACALLVDMAVSGLLCPAQYLASLVARVRTLTATARR